MAVPLEVVDAGAGVWLARGRDVNWTLLVEGTDVTLIDAGYPGYADAVRESVERIGRSWSDVVGVLVTHGHVDHIGGLPTLLIARDVPVHCSAAELPNLVGQRHESAGTGDVVRHVFGHGVLPWAVRILRVGGSEVVEVPSATSFDPLRTSGSGGLDLPGRPVPVPTPGHTSGHTAYLVPSAGAVATGDTLCTGHALSRTDGPQLLEPWFDHDRAAVVGQLDTLAALDADVLLPGHGPLLRTPIATAAATARERL